MYKVIEDIKANLVREENAKKNMICFSGELKRQTPNAYLVYDGAIEVWLPKSQTIKDGDNFFIPEWLAKDKGII